MLEYKYILVQLVIEKANLLSFSIKKENKSLKNNFFFDQTKNVYIIVIKDRGRGEESGEFWNIMSAFDINFS